MASFSAALSSDAVVIWHVYHTGCTRCKAVIRTFCSVGYPEIPTALLSPAGHYRRLSVLTQSTVLVAVIE